MEGDLLRKYRDGYIIPKGETPPADHVVAGDLNDSNTYILPKQILETEHAQYTTADPGAAIYDPSTFARSYHKASTALASTGITNQADSNTVNVGVDFKGNPVYSNAQLANNKDTSLGTTAAFHSGMALGAMGAFSSQDEADRYVAIGLNAQDPNHHAKLDQLKSAGDVNGFVNAIGAANDRYTGYKMYENWNNFSPAQKSIGSSTTGIQNFKFNDGQTFETKRLTPEIPGVPAMSAGDGLQLASQGINVPPATRKWNQLSAIQETQFTPKKSSDVVNTAQSLGILGYDVDGRSVPIDNQKMSQMQMQPAPHYGIGAVTLPLSSGTPTGYSIVKNMGDKNIAIPTANKGTALVNAPDVASRSAGNIYGKWNKKDNVKQDRGVVGGSALSGGLDSMATTNPYSLGAVITHASFEHVDPKGKDNDISHVSQLLNVSLNRLSTGDVGKSTDGKENYPIHSGTFDEKTYGATVKDIRGKYAQQGVSSKEIGYQLANQGFAEGRFDESQATALHRSLDMVFDDNSYVLAQKLNTGKSKGMSILEKRRG